MYSRTAAKSMAKRLYLRQAGEVVGIKIVHCRKCGLWHLHVS